MTYTIIPKHCILNFQHILETENDLHRLEVEVKCFPSGKNRDAEYELTSADCRGRDFLEFLTLEQKADIYDHADAELSEIRNRAYN